MSKRRINVRAIVWHNGKLLAVKHKSDTGEEAPYWALPGGGLDPNELLTTGVTRELMEETGIEARVGRLLFMQQFASSREGWNEELEFFYHVENPETFTTIDLASTTHGLEELARIEFINPKEEYILPAFLSSVDIAQYVNTVHPVLLHNELT